MLNEQKERKIISQFEMSGRVPLEFFLYDIFYIYFFFSTTLLVWLKRKIIIYTNVRGNYIYSRQNVGMKGTYVFLLLGIAEQPERSLINFTQGQNR